MCNNVISFFFVKKNIEKKNKEKTIKLLALFLLLLNGGYSLDG